MNCHQVNSILDSSKLSDLDAAGKDEIERHFESCRTCRAAWSAFADIAATPIPTMSDSLQSRIAHVVALHLPARRPRMRRALLAGGVLVIGAAASTLALRVADRRSDDASGTNQPAAVAGPAQSAGPIETAPAVAPAESAAETPSAGPVVAAIEDSIANSLDPRSLVVLIDDSSDDAEARSALDRCHQAVVDRLNAVDGLNVISGSAVSAYLSTGMSNAEVARALGAGAFLALSSLARCDARLYEAQTGAFLAGQVADASLIIEGASRPPGVEYGDDGIPLNFYDNLARQVADKLLTDEATLMAEAQAAFLNTALSEGERLAALHRTSIGNSYFNEEILSAAVVAGLSQIMASSTDAENRRTAVLLMDGQSNPEAVDPLLYVLAYDDATQVRVVAASALHTFVDDGRVRDALSRVVAADPDDDASIICCDYTLAEAARRALLSDEELRDRSMAQLMNPSLSDMQRLLPLVSWPDGREVTGWIDGDEASVVFEIGSRADEPVLRARAWTALYAQANPNADYLPTLLDDLEHHPDDDVRYSAANALTAYADDPSVRASFERVIAEDPCECVRTTLTRALDGAEAAAQ